MKLLLSFCLVAVLSSFQLVESRKLLNSTAAHTSALSQTYTCVTSGVLQSPCFVNPASTFGPGFKVDTSNPADRVYQAIIAQHVLCYKRATQAACQAMEPATIHCIWDSLNTRCQPDLYASLLMPLVCPGSKAHKFMTCGRKGMINACKTDTNCVVSAQGRCYPAWLVAEAKAANKSEQSTVEEAALMLLKGDAQVAGTCPEASLLKRMTQICPFHASWDSCNTSVCEFSTPTFIPTRPQQLSRSNSSSSTPAPTTFPTVHGPSMPQNITYEMAPAGSTDELSYYDMYPGPVCFPDVQRVPMVLHKLLGVSAALSEQLEAAQNTCAAMEDVINDVARGVAACGFSLFEYDSTAVLQAVGGLQPPAGAGSNSSQHSTVPSSPTLAVGKTPTSSISGGAHQQKHAPNIASESDPVLRSH